MTEATRKLNNKLRHHPKSFSFFGPASLGSSAAFSRRAVTADKVSIPSVKVWCGHRRGLFVEGVAVDTDGREAALEPEARVNKPPAAERVPRLEQMRLSQAKQT